MSGGAYIFIILTLSEINLTRRVWLIYGDVSLLT